MSDSVKHTQKSLRPVGYTRDIAKSMYERNNIHRSAVKLKSNVLMVNYRKLRNRVYHDIGARQGSIMNLGSQIMQAIVRSTYRKATLRRLHYIRF